MSSTASLKSKIVNVSGDTLNLSFIGNGVELADGAEYEFIGTLTEAVTRGKNTSRAARALEALEALLLQSPAMIEVVSSPAVLVYDATDDVTKQISLDNGALIAISPSWLSTRYSSSL